VERLERALIMGDAVEGAASAAPAARKRGPPGARVEPAGAVSAAQLMCSPPLLAAASGGLLLLTAPPISLTPLAFVALTPLLLAVHAAHPPRAAILGWTAGAIFHLGLVPWLLPTIVRLQHGSIALATAAFAAYVAYHSLQFALAMAGARLVGGGSVAATTVAWLLAEWAFPKVLPWSLGAVLGPHPDLRQCADLAGGLGLSALVVAVNALLAAALRAWPGERRRAGAVLAVAGVLLASASCYGRLPSAPGSGGLRIGVVQAGDVSPGDPDPARAAAATLRSYARASVRLPRPLDLVVWPEQVVRAALRHSDEPRDALERTARAVAAPLILGALDAGPGGERSAAYLFAPRLAAVRHKATLVPFGEYVPGAEWFAFLRRWHLASPITAGAEPRPIRLGAARLATAICYEAIRPATYNAAVLSGAEVLLNLSDDSWFDSPWAAAQHLEMTRLRAVETRRWLVRASHSGMSAVIDARGEVRARLGFGRAGALAVEVERRRGIATYVRYGDAPAVAVAMVVVGSRVLAAALRARRRWHAATGRDVRATPEFRRDRTAAPRSARRRRGAPALRR